MQKKVNLLLRLLWDLEQRSAMQRWDRYSMRYSPKARAKQPAVFVPMACAGAAVAITGLVQLPNLVERLLKK